MKNQISEDWLRNLRKSKQTWNGMRTRRTIELRKEIEDALMPAISGLYETAEAQLRGETIQSPFDSEIYESLLPEYAREMEKAGFIVELDLLSCSLLVKVPADWIGE